MTRMSGGTGIFSRLSGGTTLLTSPSPRLPAVDYIPCRIIYQNPAGNVMSGPPDARERPTPAPRARRGAEICFQCRNRKVRCDGAPGGCENCRRLHFECSLSAPPADDPRGLGLTQLERRRVRRACVACRDRKSKCSGSYPSCVRCVRLGVECQYPSVGRASSAMGAGQASVVRESRISGEASSLRAASPAASGAVQSTSSASPALSISSELNIGKTIIKQHIDAFFDHIHPIPCHGFLHRATLLQSWQKGTLNQRLLLAICGLTTRYVFRGDVDRQQTARHWIASAESQLLTRLGEPRMSDVEAWMLVTLDHILSRRFGKMLVSMGLTARLAYILRLNHEEERLPFLIQERRRRLMWSIFTMDTLYSSGRAEFTACSRETLHIRLPCNERSFTMDVPVVTEPLVPTPETAGNAANLGLMAYCLRVLDIRDRTQRVSLMITNRKRPLPQCLAIVDTIDHELASLLSSLPPSYRFDRKNFFLRAYTPSRTPFLMLHAWWHQTHCDLYRFAIPGFREGLPAADLALLPSDYAATCRAKCLEHALAVADVLDTARGAGVDIIADPSLAMCAFHSARIIARLGGPPLGNVSKGELLEKLGACAGALEEQAGMYPTTGILRGGILDLMDDVQRAPGESYWEGEGEAESRRRAEEGRAEEGREVYSRYSVTEEIRKMRFREDEGEDEGGDAVAQAVEARRGDPVQDVRQRESFDAEGGIEGDLPMGQTQLGQTQLAMNPFGPPPDSALAFGAGGFDVSMTLGWDPRHQSGQPDMFMDSFWPIQQTMDWTMMDMEQM